MRACVRVCVRLCTFVSAYIYKGAGGGGGGACVRKEKGVIWGLGEKSNRKAKENNNEVDLS